MPKPIAFMPLKHVLLGIFFLARDRFEVLLLNFRSWPGAVPRLFVANDRNRCTTAAQIENMDFALRVAAFHFSASLTKGSFRLLPAAAVGREYALAILKSSRSGWFHRVTAATGGSGRQGEVHGQLVSGGLTSDSSL